MPQKTKALVSEEAIANKIVRVRGEWVMLDRDLAEMYGVETRVLNQAVSRNIGRFPEDFMFLLTRDEILMKFNPSGTPFAFSFRELNVSSQPQEVKPQKNNYYNLRVLHP